MNSKEMAAFVREQFANCLAVSMYEPPRNWVVATLLCNLKELFKIRKVTDLHPDSILSAVSEVLATYMSFRKKIRKDLKDLTDEKFNAVFPETLFADSLPDGFDTVFHSSRDLKNFRMGTYTRDPSRKASGKSVYDFYNSVMHCSEPNIELLKQQEDYASSLVQITASIG